MVFDLDDDLIDHIHGEEDYYYPSPVVEKVNLMDISIIPWEGKKFSVVALSVDNDPSQMFIDVHNWLCFLKHAKLFQSQTQTMKLDNILLMFLMKTIVLLNQLEF